MALDKLTKITGPGIATDTNWVGNNADFTGITTTATSFNIGVLEKDLERFFICNITSFA